LSELTTMNDLSGVTYGIKFSRAFALNPSPRLEDEALMDIASEIRYICPGPVYDAMANDVSAFSKMVEKSLDNFDPVNDVLVAFGDPVVLSLATSYLSELYDSFKLARFSKFKRGYVVFNIVNSWESNNA
jgi:hypothetical protein